MKTDLIANWDVCKYKENKESNMDNPQTQLCAHG